jgi:hypothetical protein
MTSNYEPGCFVTASRSDGPAAQYALRSVPPLLRGSYGSCGTPFAAGA